MAKPILPRCEAMDALCDVALIERVFTGSHTFAFDAKISFLIAKLVQETKSDINAPKHFGSVVVRVEYFVFAHYLKI